MADDVNKASGRYNQIGAAASMDEVFSRVKQSNDISSIASQRLRFEGREIKKRLSDLRINRDIIAQGMRLAPNEPDLQAGWKQNRDEYAESLERRQLVAQRYEQEQQIGRARSSNLMISQINQYTGTRAQSHRINEVFSSSATMDAAARGIGPQSYSDFERQSQMAARSARESAVNLREAAAAGASESELRKLGGNLAQSEGQIGIAKRGMQLARQMGLDPLSQLQDINSVSSRASARLQTEDYRKQAEGGNLPSLNQLNKEILEAAQALKTLKEEFDAGKKPLEEFNKEAGAAAEKLTKLEQQEKAVAAAGGGGGNGWRTLAAAGGAISAGVNFGQQAFINQPIQALNIKAQMAQAQNQQYATLKSALGGDMASLALIGSGAFQNAADFASGKRATQMTMSGLGAAATATDAAARAAIEITEGQSLGKVGGGQVGSVAKGAIIGAEGLFNTATQVSGMAQGIPQGETNVNAYSSALEAQRSILAVPAQFRQSYFDYGKNVTEATRFAGSSREGMMKNLMGNDFLNQMQGIRVDPNKAAAMVGQGLAGQGSAFSMGQITSARNMERAGFGPMEESMRRFGALGGAGATNSEASLAKVFEEAVSRGMDSSKAVSLMVDSTASLAESSGAGRLGIDATGGVSALIGRTIGERGGRSEIAAMTAANTAIAGTSNNLTDSSVTFTNMVRDTRMRQMGMSGPEAAAAKSLTTQDISILQGGGEAAQRLAMQKGLVSLIGKDGTIDKGAVNKFANIQGQFLELGGAGGIGQVYSPEVTAKASEFRKRLAAGEDPKKLMAEDKVAFGAIGQIATLSGQGGAQEVSNIIGSYQGVADRAKTGNGGKIMNGTAPLGAETVGGEAAGTGAAVQVNKEIQAGRKDMESLDKVSKVLGAIEKAVTPETMEKFASAASSAAGNMEISATNFKALSDQAGLLNTEFSKLKTTLESLNTSAANLGGFNTKGGNKGLSASDIQAETGRIKERADKKPQ